MVPRGSGVAGRLLDPGTTKNGEGCVIPLNRDAVLALRAVPKGSILDGALPTWAVCRIARVRRGSAH